jgi:hypothetical protein
MNAVCPEGHHKVHAIVDEQPRAVLARKSQNVLGESE